MQFERAATLVRHTPTDALVEAWSTSPMDVLAAQKGERPMTISEAGTLADLHGLKLLDILSV